MKISIEATEKVVEFQIGTAKVPARIWEGHTSEGTPVHCFITRICPSIPEPLPGAIAEEFARSLDECAAPSAAIRAISMRMIL